MVRAKLSNHGKLNQIIIQCAFIIGTSSRVHLCSDDGKQTDAILLGTSENRQKLIWDVTCGDKLAESYLI